MKKIICNPVTTFKNKGDNRECAFGNYIGMTKAYHDDLNCFNASDFVKGDMRYSVKGDGFTLMSGYLAPGADSFDAIWTIFRTKVHSNCFVYVDADFNAYMMNIDEFESFVYMFGYMAKESDKNGGGWKIRCKHESKKMVRWLSERVAA